MFQSDLLHASLLFLRSLIQIPSYLFKCLLNNLLIQRTRLHKRRIPILLTPVFSLSCGYLPINFFIFFVSKYEKWEIVDIALGHGFFQKVRSPRGQMLERLRAGHIVDQDTGFGAAVESSAQGLVPFLSGRVPNLHCDCDWGAARVSKFYRVSFLLKKSAPIVGLYQADIDLRMQFQVIDVFPTLLSNHKC